MFFALPPAGSCVFIMIVSGGRGGPQQLRAGGERERVNCVCQCCGRSSTVMAGGGGGSD